MGLMNSQDGMPRNALPRRVLAVTALLGTLAALASCNDSQNGMPGSIPVPNSVAIADVNGDGLPDLLVATTADQGTLSNPGYANVILNTQASPGTFMTGVQYPTASVNPTSMAVADLTGSGRLDLVVATLSGAVSVYLHDSTPGTFKAAVSYNSGGQPNQVVIADVNGDGFPDLVLADLSQQGSVIILLQDAANPGTFSAPMVLPTQLSTASAQVADLNGDGLADIVATGYDLNGNHGQVLVFFQNAAQPGTFLAAVSFPAGPQPQSVKIADMNGDGLPDLVVADFGPGGDGTGIGGVSILLQDPAHPGSFLAPVSYATPGGAVDVAVGDLDGDGKPDVVVANLNPPPTGSVSVLLQDPAHAGSLLSASSYEGFGEPIGVAIGDLNNDGHPDIAVADAQSATVLWAIPGSPGSFQPAAQVGQ
jgi:hypothetical protein